MAKRKYKAPPVLTPRYVGGVVVTRIPAGTDERTKANVMAVAKQMAYDYSEHPEQWGYQYKRRQNNARTYTKSPFGF